MLRRRTWVAMCAFAVVLGAGPSGDGYPLGTDGHAHWGYPPVPSGLSEIRRVFGEPCSADAHALVMPWVAADNGKTYNVWFHRKLGWPESSNLDTDIRFHIRTEGYDDNVLSGIWGYNCRTIAGTTKWSTHAWGIAVDINSAYEHYGHDHCHTVPWGLGQIWRDHGWTWGRAFKDCMHFQYARDY